MAGKVISFEEYRRKKLGFSYGDETQKLFSSEPPVNNPESHREKQHKENVNSIFGAFAWEKQQLLLINAVNRTYRW